MKEKYTQAVEAMEVDELAFTAEELLGLSANATKEEVIEAIQSTWDSLEPYEQAGVISEDSEFEEIDLEPDTGSMSILDEPSEMKLAASEFSFPLISEIVEHVALVQLKGIIPEQIPLKGEKIGWGVVKLRLERVEINHSLKNVAISRIDDDKLTFSVDFNANGRLVYRVKKVWKYGSEGDKNIHIAGGLKVVVTFTKNGKYLVPDIKITSDFTRASFHFGRRISIRSILNPIFNIMINKKEPQLSKELYKMLNKK